MSTNQLIVVAAFAIVLLSMLLVMVFTLSMLRPWLRGFMGGAPVSVIQLIGMRLRGNPPGLLVDTLLTLRHRGVDASIREVESSYIANKGQVDQPARLASIVEERLRSLRAANADH